MADIIENLTTGTVSNIINNLNSNFGTLNEAFKEKKVNTNSLEDNTKKQLENIRAKYTNADKEEISKNYKDSLDTQKKALEIQKQLTEEGKSIFTGQK